MPKTTIQDRAAGAIMGAFIGDALGLGPHWYYDLEDLRRNYGEWISAVPRWTRTLYHAPPFGHRPRLAGEIMKILTLPMGFG